MNTRQKCILIGLKRDGDALKSRPCPTGYHVGMERQKWRDGQEGFVRVDPRRWIGRDVTTSESAMNSKAYKALEAAGLVERHNLNDSTQTTHLRLTDAGRIVAEHLRDEDAADAYLPNSAQTVAPQAGGAGEPPERGPADA
jgi:hypothetical protein